MISEEHSELGSGEPPIPSIPSQSRAGAAGSKRGAAAAKSASACRAVTESVWALSSQVCWLLLQGQFHRKKKQSTGISVIKSDTSTGAFPPCPFPNLDVHNQNCQEEGEDSYKRQIRSFSLHSKHIQLSFPSLVPLAFPCLFTA